MYVIFSQSIITKQRDNLIFCKSAQCKYRERSGFSRHLAMLFVARQKVQVHHSKTKVDNLASYPRACICAQSFSSVPCFVTPWTAARQAPLSTKFSRQEYWNGLPVPPPVDLCGPGMEPTFPVAPALAGRLFTAEPPGKPKLSIQLPYNL